MTNQAIKHRRKGTTFHKTVTLLEKSILHNSNVTIKESEYLEDKITKRLREHDIVLYIKEEHHTLKVAIECKDWKTKIGSPQVEAFVTKCQDTLIDRGIMVSSLGFSKPAITKAKNNGIDCLTLKEVESLRWLKTKYFEKLETKLIKVFVDLSQKNKPPKDFTKYEVIDKNNNVIDEKVFRLNADKIYRNLNIKFKEGKQVLRVPIKADGLYLRKINDKMSKVHITSLSFFLTVECKITKLPFVNYRYTNQDSKNVISDFAVAKTVIQNTNITFTMVSGSDGINLSIHSEEIK